MIKKKIAALLSAFLLMSVTACGQIEEIKNITSTPVATESVSLEEVPEYKGEPYVEVNNNEPEFEESDLTTNSYEEYSELDADGKCGTAEASIGKDLMPTEGRGNISSVKPTGWHSVQYDHVDGKSLYNRCHLIGYQLTAENANEKNLITGTRYMNVEGMLPFENEVADYVKETGNHVMYRVTPIFEEENLVASGVQMEAESVEDDGEGVSFNVYVYNVQPGVEIDYATGESWEASEDGTVDRSSDADNTAENYVLNENNKKFHKPDCSSVKDIHKKNRKKSYVRRSELLEQGYEPCGRCKP